MKGDIRISKKAALSIIAAMGVYAMADFVTIVDTKSTGGITVTGGMTESEVEAAIQTAVATLEAKHDSEISALKLEMAEDLPIGSVTMWVNSTPPTGWIEMRGQSTSGYPELAAIVGSSVPDMRGQFARGWDNSRGLDTTSGRSIGSDQDYEFKGLWLSSWNNTETGATYAHSNQFFKNIGSPDVSSTGYTQFLGKWENQSAGLRVGFGTEEVRPTNVALMYIIKAE